MIPMHIFAVWMSQVFIVCSMGSACNLSLFALWAHMKKLLHKVLGV